MQAPPMRSRVDEHQTHGVPCTDAAGAANLLLPSRCSAGPTTVPRNPPQSVARARLRNDCGFERIGPGLGADPVCLIAFATLPAASDRLLADSNARSLQEGVA